MAVHERAEDGQQPLLDRCGVQRGEQHHQAPPGAAGQHGADHPRVVGLDQGRLQRRHRLHQRGQQAGRGDPLDPGAHPPVVGEQVDPVAGPGRQRREQEGGVHRRVQPGRVADPGRGGAPAVEQQQHPTVALRPPGAHHHVGRPGAGPPVDRPHVVAPDVLPQASRTRCPDRAPSPRSARRARAAGPAATAGAGGR